MWLLSYGDLSERLETVLVVTAFGYISTRVSADVGNVWACDADGFPGQAETRNLQVTERNWAEMDYVAHGPDGEVELEGRLLWHHPLVRNLDDELDYSI
ncbi:hypothetical protein E6H18_03540 [Candidatus Bathyarchaeota archaeon]|nr:MAG: hypothetical protein E6H18_03540 [Candidatus Bathyarchaeota archaeon]